MWRSVLVTAIKDLRFRAATGRWQQRQRMESERVVGWFLSLGEEAGTFCWACRTLDINAGNLIVLLRKEGVL